MRIHRTIFGMLALALGITTQASAVTRTMPGASCQPRNGSQLDSNLTGYNQYGPYSTSATPIEVVCPAQIDGTPVSAQMKFYDRSPTAGLQCTMRLLNADGLQLWSTSNGSTVAFVSQNVQTEPLPVNFPTAAKTAVLECSIPGLNNGAASHMTSYSFTF